MSIKKSKLLSKALRHHPEILGITLDEHGWASTEALLAGLDRIGEAMSLDELQTLVRTNDKQRFCFSEDGSKIRANQGHSVDVDLNLATRTPPARLYHGTATRNLPSIEQHGLQRQSRHDVHLHMETRTARQVGQRHGKPVILKIDAAAMHADGMTFRCSPNGVWLTESVPPKYLSIVDD